MRHNVLFRIGEGRNGLNPVDSMRGSLVMMADIIVLALLIVAQG